jgi:hypothetical protein
LKKPAGYRIPERVNPKKNRQEWSTIAKQRRRAERSKRGRRFQKNKQAKIQKFFPFVLDPFWIIFTRTIKL